MEVQKEFHLQMIMYLQVVLEVIIGNLNIMMEESSLVLLVPLSLIKTKDRLVLLAIYIQIIVIHLQIVIAISSIIMDMEDLIEGGTMDLGNI